MLHGFIVFIFIFVDWINSLDTYMKAGTILRRLKKTMLWILGLWLGFLLLIQIVLLSPIFTPIANSLAGEFLDASVSIGSASGSVFSHFPKITLNVEDLEITYPHERYDSIAKAGVQGHLLYRGCGESVDTLASIKNLSTSISLLALVSGNIRLPDIEVDSPKIFAHYYDEEHANWNIFFDDEEEEDPTEEGMNIIFKKINMTGRPRIVYTDSQDSLFTMITVNSLSFDGNYQTDAIHKTLADAEIERLFIAGRYGADTLALGIDALKTTMVEDHMHLEVTTNAYMATKAFGRMKVPVKFSSDVSLPEDPDIAVSLRNMKADVATIPASGDMDIVLRDDNTLVDGQIDIPRCNIQTFLQDYMASFVPELKNVQSNTELSATAKISGGLNYVTGALPRVEIAFNIPDSEIDYSTFPEKIRMGMDADFVMDTTGMMSADIKKARINTYGLGLDTALGIDDITGDDPKFLISGGMRASLDSLRHFLPDTLNIIAQGDIFADLDGTIKMSEMDMYKFSNAALDGTIRSGEIIFQMPDDTIDIRMNGMDIQLKPEFIKSRRNHGTSFRLMGVTGKIASADVVYKEAFSFKGGNIELGARNSSDNKEDSHNVNYLGGHVNAELLQIQDSEGTSIKLDNTKNSFQMRPKRGQPEIPVLSVSNQNQRITYITLDNRAILTDSKISMRATLNTIDRAKRREAILDSLANIYPEIPRDSLMIHMRAQRRAQSVPSWMLEEEFKSSDIKVDLNETFKKYFREWDVEGSAGIRTGIIMTPYFPLRNILRGTSLSFDNSHVSVDSIKFVSGASEIRAEGSLNGLRRLMMGRGDVLLDMNISSGSVNGDELLRAYTTGSMYVPDDTRRSSDMSNSEFFKQVTTDTVSLSDSAPALFVLPGNLTANINLDASGIRYKALDISSLKAKMAIRERCAQLTGGTMRSNMGGFDLDAFYATKSKSDIRTGFCLDVKDVTSERVIALVPEIGEMMPVIGSIKGLMNCEIAATASLDTTMNIIMPSVNGIIRLSGKDLSISDDDLYTTVAKKLMFKNKKKGEIDELMIEGTIKDNRVEVFPFILKLDRYTLGLSGVQNMDMSYKHHISVLRSPIILRLGLNMSGPDYDHMKFRLGRAQYRIKKMPSFTSVIDQTKEELKQSIYNIFETGVDKTIDRRDMQSLIAQQKNELGYVNAAEVEIEELSEEEQKQLEESEKAESDMDEVMAAAVAAVQEVLKK